MYELCGVITITTNSININWLCLIEVDTHLPILCIKVIAKHLDQAYNNTSLLVSDYFVVSLCNI